MIDPTKTTPEKLAEMNDSLIVDNNHLRERLRAFKVAAYRRGCTASQSRQFVLLLGARMRGLTTSTSTGCGCNDT